MKEDQATQQFMRRSIEQALAGNVKRQREIATRISQAQTETPLFYSVMAVADLTGMPHPPGIVYFVQDEGAFYYYNQGTLAFEATAGGGGGATTLDGLSDVVITTPATNAVLMYNGSAWIDNPLDSTYITDFSEAVDDRVGALFIDSTDLDLTYTDGSNTLSATIIAAAVTNAKLASMSAATVKGQIVGGSGAPVDLTATQLNAIVGSAALTSTFAIQGLTMASRGATASLSFYDRATDTVSGIWYSPTAGDLRLHRSGVGDVVVYNGDGLTLGSSPGVTTDGSLGGKQFFVANPSDTTEWLGMGYNHANDCGFIYAIDTGVAWKNLALGPTGGTVTVGGWSANGIFNVFAPDGSIANYTAIPTSGNTTSILEKYVWNTDWDFKLRQEHISYSRIIYHFTHRFNGSELDVLTFDNNYGAGGLGVGTTRPQGALHVVAASGGKLFTTKTAIDGTAQTLIPDGTGDATIGVKATYIATGSGGTSTFGSGDFLNNTDTTIFTTGGGSVLKFRVNSNGSVDLRRSAGSETFTVVVDMIWR